MTFKDEFKKEMRKVSPTEEQRERIRSGVMKRISDNSEPVPKNKKKPLYLKIAAVSGSAVCAAAIAIFAIAGVHNYKITNGVNSGMSANNAGGQANTSFSSQAETMTSQPLFDNAGCVTKDPEPNGADASNAPAESLYDSTDTKNSITGTDDLPTNSSKPYTADSNGEAPGEAPESGDNPISNMGGSGVYLDFSDDRSDFSTVINGETHYYEITNRIVEFSPTLADKALSNYGETLFIQSEGDLIALFKEDKSFVGVYRMKK